jgi:hypothetical protein
VCSPLLCPCTDPLMLHALLQLPSAACLPPLLQPETEALALVARPPFGLRWTLCRCMCALPSA